MKMDINFGLLAVVIAVLIAFVTYTTYYQYSFKNVTGLYQNKLGELDKI